MAANEAKIVITAADQASKKLDGITEKARGMRTAFLAIGAATTAIGVVSVKAASDLEESAQAAEVTFKSAFKSVDEFANGAAGAFNLSRRAAFEYTAQLGGIFNASGLTAQASANMSVEATKLSADLASFKNLEIDVALQKIRAGLVGEVEPLRTVGVLLSAAAVEAKAMALGLGDANGELSEGEKVQARFALITEQLADAQGDVARTSESVANQTRKMQKNMEDLRAEIGEKLLPVTSDLLSKMNALVVQLEKVPEPAMTAGVAIGGITAAVAGLGLIIPPLVTGGGALVTFAGILASIAAAPITLGIAALGAGIGIISAGMKDIASDVDQANESLHGFDGVLKTIGEQQKYDDILEQIISIEDAFGDFRMTFEDMATVFQSRSDDMILAGQNLSDALVLQMTSIDNAYEGTKNKAIELQRFMNDNGNLINDNARDAAKEAEQIALDEAEAIVAASEQRYAKLRENRKRDLANDLEFLKKRSDAVEALKAENLKAFEAIRSEVLNMPSVIPAGGITSGSRPDIENAMRAFKDSQSDVVQDLNEARARLAQGDFGIGAASEQGLLGEIRRLENIIGSEQFKGTALGALVGEARGGFGGAPPMLDGTIGMGGTFNPLEIGGLYGQGNLVQITVEGSVVAEDLPSVIEKGLQELADQGGGYVGGAKFAEEDMWN